MASVQVLQDNHKYYIIKVLAAAAEGPTNIVDVSALAVPCTRVKLVQIEYDVGAGSVITLAWDATSDVNMLVLSEGPGQTLDFRDIGGLINNGGAGVTGDVMYTKTGTTDSSIVLTFQKKGLLGSF